MRQAFSHGLMDSLRRSSDQNKFACVNPLVSVVLCFLCAPPLHPPPLLFIQVVDTHYLIRSTYNLLFFETSGVGGSPKGITISYLVT